MLNLRLPGALVFAHTTTHYDHLMEVVTVNSLPHYHRCHRLGCAPADEHGQVWVSWDNLADDNFLANNLCQWGGHQRFSSEGQQGLKTMLRAQVDAAWARIPVAIPQVHGACRPRSYSRASP